MRPVYLILILACSLFGYELRFVGKEMWPFASEIDKKRSGYVIELLQRIYVPHGYSPTYETLPWPRALMSASRDVHNGIMLISKSPGKKQIFIFPKESVGMIANVFFAKKGATKWRYDGIKSLKEVTVGVIKSYTYGFELDDYFNKYRRTPDLVDVTLGVDALQKNLKKLIIGRIDVVFDDVQAVQGTAAKMGILDQLEAVGFDNTKPVYVAFSSKNQKAQKLADIFDDGMRKLRKDGSLERTLEHYGIDDWH